MKKVIVIGCPGSGKSTFAKKLHMKTNIPLFHLDMMYWKEDKTVVEKSVFLDKLFTVLQQDEWIIDGNYASSMELRIDKCDTIFFLGYPLDVCLSGINERKGKVRSDMPWVEKEDDDEFIEFVKNYNLQNRPLVMKLLDKYSYKNIIIFHSRDEPKQYLKSI